MAITKELFRTLIQEGQEEVGSVELYNRPFCFEESGRYVFVGVRQAGKSYMLYKRAKQLLSAGHELNEVVYINFDDERLIGMKAEEFDLILQAYGTLYEGRPLLFFDEIQNVDGWEHFARRLANQKYSVFITGSNAKMLSRDIQTTLGGRYIEAQIMPYSFREYLEAQGIKLSKNWQYGLLARRVQQQFRTYLLWGGFPELLLFANKRRWLNDLYEKILLGDVLQRNNIKNEMALRMVMKRLAMNVMQPTSYNRLANLVKALGVSTSVTSVIDYVEYGRDACFLFSLENYAAKFVEKEGVKKHYFIDNGLLNIFLTGGEALLLENLCATHLHRLYDKEVYFYNRNVEVDFYVPSQAYAVQVAYTLVDETTRSREVEALKKLCALYPLRRMVIVTAEEEEHIELANGQRIEVLPAWKWLLEDVEVK